MVKARSVRRKGVSNSLQATITADYPQIWLIFDSQVNSDFLVTIIKSIVAKVLAWVNRYWKNLHDLKIFQPIFKLRTPTILIYYPSKPIQDS